eukprot:gene14374-biopygen5769
MSQDKPRLGRWSRANRLPVITEGIVKKGGPTAKRRGQALWRRRRRSVIDQLDGLIACMEGCRFASGGGSDQWSWELGLCAECADGAVINSVIAKGYLLARAVQLSLRRWREAITRGCARSAAPRRP